MTRPDLIRSGLSVAEVDALKSERDKFRSAAERLLKHAASEPYWQQQSVDHWDKPGPHNAAINALRAIKFAKDALAERSDS